jgi:phosphoglycolate phosphatase-like HAD superfamily hydrolase
LKTFLFDIDGTLLRTGGAGLQAMRTTMRQLFGVESLARVEVRGRTDRAIVRDLFAAHCLADSPDNWREFQSVYHAHLPSDLARCAGTLLPGVRDGLTWLSERTDVALGLLTGNSQAAARIKLSHFELDHWFAFGGFGDRQVCRNEVAQEAIRAAQAHLAERFDRDRVWVIGDTPLDVESGRSIGARTVAVTTGGYLNDELAAANPDFLLTDLTHLPRVVAEID